MIHYPEFVWNGFFWEANVNLPAFAGFQERNGPYGTISSRSPSNGDIKIAFGIEGRDSAPLCEKEKNLIQYALDNHEKMVSVLKQVMFLAYPDIKEGYIEECGSDVEEFFPPLEKKEDIKCVMGVTTIHIHPIEKDGIPIVGLEMGCNWEEEHGLGILFWRDKILNIGNADTSFVNWIVRENAAKISHA